MIHADHVPHASEPVARLIYMYIPLCMWHCARATPGYSPYNYASDVPTTKVNGSSGIGLRKHFREVLDRGIVLEWIK